MSSCLIHKCIIMFIKMIMQMIILDDFSKYHWLSRYCHRISIHGFIVSNWKHLQLIKFRNIQGAESIWRCHFTSKRNPIVEIRRSYDHLISTMGFPILVRWHLYIESWPWYPMSYPHQLWISVIVDTLIRRQSAMILVQCGALVPLKCGQCSPKS